ncbi:hypothetical protein [Halorussus halophilus]|uniref:hypothetical protein n=1 Tax=Halorussus halophilus TaxID=2650975 RepID=UPI0013012EC6|nr:hypothetical protein [Halorussus halophilus]
MTLGARQNGEDDRENRRVIELPVERVESPESSLPGGRQSVPASTDRAEEALALEVETPLVHDDWPGVEGVFERADVGGTFSVYRFEDGLLGGLGGTHVSVHLVFSLGRGG